jgi:hypothetical protein
MNIYRGLQFAFVRDRGLHSVAIDVGTYLREIPIPTDVARD